MDKSQPRPECPPYTPLTSPARHPQPCPRPSRNTSSQQRCHTRWKAEREASLEAADCIEKTNAENISAAKIVAAEAATEILTAIDMTVKVDEIDQAQQVPNHVNDAYSSDLDD